MTTKSDKELAVDITIALITANKRFSKYTGGESNTTLTVDETISCINSIHKALKNLD